MNDSSKFLRWARYSLILVYLVILAGAVVRATGSGMGCPDWPKCFGFWIPPTDVSQLPANYQEIYAEHSYADNHFNALKTWIEYINRLLGATLGLFILALFGLSFRFLKSHPGIVILCFLELLLMGFQAWLGKLVVASNLSPLKITTHMLAAFLIIAVLLFIYRLATPSTNFRFRQYAVTPKLKWLTTLTLALTLIQVYFGTQIRQKVDLILTQNTDLTGSAWTTGLEPWLLVHKNMALAVLLINFVLFIQLKKNLAPVAYLQRNVLILLFIELISGILLNYAGLPPFIQPVHLLLVSIVFGYQFWLWLNAMMKTN
jgi:cytochrome c oxidase assembly protein subunit 15